MVSTWEISYLRNHVNYNQNFRDYSIGEVSEEDIPDNIIERDETKENINNTESIDSGQEKVKHNTAKKSFGGNLNEFYNNMLKDKPI